MADRDIPPVLGPDGKPVDGSPVDGGDGGNAAEASTAPPPVTGPGKPEVSTPPPGNNVTSSKPPVSSSQIVSTSSPVTSSEPPTSTPSETSTPPPTEPPTTSAPPISTSPPPISTPDETTSSPVQTTITVNPDNGSTRVIVVTKTSSTPPSTFKTTTSAPATTSSDTAAINHPSGSGNTGLKQGSKVAIGVVVPIAAIAIIAIVALYWWKKHRAKKEEQEERRKEVEDYSYNPNADPTIPAVGMAGVDNSYEDGSSGYRGWGSTVAGSTGRKASTTMSGGVPGVAYSDATAPALGNVSEGRSNADDAASEGEILGAMGPSAANNRHGDVHRGISNASSSYSAAGLSEGSDGGMAASYGAGGTYYDQYGQNPYSDNPGQDGAGGPVIRDNPARRNTRIENPSHFPQQSAGIAQNF